MTQDLMKIGNRKDYRRKQDKELLKGKYANIWIITWVCFYWNWIEGTDIFSIIFPNRQK